MRWRYHRSDIKTRTRKGVEVVAGLSYGCMRLGNFAPRLTNKTIKRRFLSRVRLGAVFLEFKGLNV